MKRIGTWVREATADESGGTLVEYVMLASLIAVVSVSAVTLLGQSVRGRLEAPRAALSR
jgi:Flp pilus assembly pilin Flp